MQRSELEEMGFSRRYSRSRGWPGGRLSLKGVEDGAVVPDGWQWRSSTGDIARWTLDRSKGDPLLDRVGDRTSVALADKMDRRRLIAFAKKILQKGVSSEP